MRKHGFVAVAFALALGALAAGCDMKQKIMAPPVNTGNLVVNEFLASNSSFGTDENGEHDDWIELYNRSSHAINIGGYRVTDNLGDHQKYVIPSDSPSATTIPPGGFLIIWCDGTPDQGPLHTNFKLSGTGEDIGLYDTTGEPVEEFTFAAQATDISYGRTTDGAATWQFFTTPTPGTSNGGGGGSTHPVISNIQLSPATPTAGAAVTVSASITDDGSVSSATLHYAIGAGSFVSAVMTHGSGNSWSATIPGQAASTTVHYYVSAADNDDNTSIEPSTAPGTSLSYTVSTGVVPVLWVNEFLASNSAGLTDPAGEHDDWIEIYNPGNSPVDLGGMYMTDDLAVKNKWQIPTTDPASSTVPAHGYLIVWADSQMDQGVVHVNFKLSASGEAIGLYTSSLEKIDEVTFGAQAADVSSARVPDGSANWTTLTTPTPGATNGSINR